MQYRLLDSAYIIPYFNKKEYLESLKEKEDKTEEEPKEEDRRHFEIGANYTLSSEENEDFDTEKSLYNVVATVGTIADIPVDAVVVKQLEGEEGKMFTLTKNDCKYLGIPFQERLMLFPKGMNWEKALTDDEKRKHLEQMINQPTEVQRKPFNPEAFDPMDLSTYPFNEADKQTDTLVLKIAPLKINGGTFKVGKMYGPISSNPQVYARNDVFGVDKQCYMKIDNDCVKVVSDDDRRSLLLFIKLPLSAKLIDFKDKEFSYYFKIYFWSELM
jgi:hypothetical protein